MWYREFRDYPIDSLVIQEPVESNEGITGCEMHEVYGWGEKLHKKKDVHWGEKKRCHTPGQ